MPRLDLLLVEKGLIKSRERAKEKIKNGEVLVNGKQALKPSSDVSCTDAIEIIGSDLKYVGRGGLKLEKALKYFDIDISGCICTDLGASTGGFTDCMLQNGAKRVYAVDVGHGQLAKSLVNDPRVINIEGVNVKDISCRIIPELCDFAAADLSFISVKYAASAAYRIISENGSAVFLIKPQFEAGRSNISKGGIVKSKKVHADVLSDICRYLCETGYSVKALTYSPIKGGDGNIEYLAYAVKRSDFTYIEPDFSQIVNEAFNAAY